MAITPAHRVSTALKKGGITTTSPESPREGVKVANMVRPADLDRARRHGNQLVRVRVDIMDAGHADAVAEMVVEVLTAAGFDAEPHPQAHTVYVREPGWRLHLDKVGRHIHAAVLSQPAPATRIAVKLRDGLVEVHAEACPQLAIPGKRYPVTGATAEEVAAELVGKAFPQTSAPARAAKLIRMHGCLTGSES